MKDKYKFIGLFYLWMFIGIPVSLIWKFLGMNTDSTLSKVIINVLCESLIFLGSFIVYRKEVIKDFKEFVKTKKVFSEIVKIYIGVLVVNISASIIMNGLADIVNVNLTGSDNNNLVQKYLLRAPILMAMGIVLIGPFYEEVIMRLGLEKGIKNKKVFAVFSGLIFGIIHVVDSIFILTMLPLIGLLIDYIFSLNKSKLFTTTCIITVLSFVSVSIVVYLSYLNISVDIKEAIYSISYIAMGGYFALMYLKYNNIFYTIVPHMIVNTIATIFLFFI